MSRRQPGTSPDRGSSFTHTALFYDGTDEFLTNSVAFIEAGLDAGEPAMVSVSRPRLHAMDAALGPAARELVRYMPMPDLGRNPAWIIPAWLDFVTPHVRAGQKVRGISEPVWAERTADELVECHRHEALLNLALTDATGFSLLCPYDVGTLDGDVLAGAGQTHPHVCRGGVVDASADYHGTLPAQLSDPLSAPPPGAEVATFHGGDAWAVRHRIAAAAAGAGLDANGSRISPLRSARPSPTASNTPAGAARSSGGPSPTSSSARSTTGAPSTIRSSVRSGPTAAAGAVEACG